MKWGSAPAASPVPASAKQGKAHTKTQSGKVPKPQRHRRNSYQPGASPQERGPNLVKR